MKTLARNQFLSAYHLGGESAQFHAEEKGLAKVRAYAARKLLYNHRNKIAKIEPASWAYWRGYADRLKSIRRAGA